MGKSTISMAIFNSFLYAYQKVTRPSVGFVAQSIYILIQVVAWIVPPQCRRSRLGKINAAPVVQSHVEFSEKWEWTIICHLTIKPSFNRLSQVEWTINLILTKMVVWRVIPQIMNLFLRVKLPFLVGHILKNYSCWLVGYILVWVALNTVLFGQNCLLVAHIVSWSKPRCQVWSPLYLLW